MWALFFGGAKSDLDQLGPINNFYEVSILVVWTILILIIPSLTKNIIFFSVFVIEGLSRLTEFFFFTS